MSIFCELFRVPTWIFFADLSSAEVMQLIMDLWRFFFKLRWTWQIKTHRGLTAHPRIFTHPKKRSSLSSTHHFSKAIGGVTIGTCISYSEQRWVCNFNCYVSFQWNIAMCYVLVEAISKIGSVAPFPTISICSIESTRQPGSVLLVKKRWKQAWEIGRMMRIIFFLPDFYGSNKEKKHGITIFSPSRRKYPVTQQKHANMLFRDAGRLKSFAKKNVIWWCFFGWISLHKNPKNGGALIGST